MIGFLRALGGYTQFCATGGFPERFLNLCKINGISLWSIKNDGVKVEACTSFKEFEKIQLPAERSGMEIKIIKNSGIPILIKRHKWRCGAVFGVLVAVLFVWLMSGCIWEVEIVEEDGVKIEDFTETLADFGVKAGVRKSKIDIQEVQEKLLKHYPQLSWVSVNIFGDKVQVEYTPVKIAHEIKDVDKPSNIVARKNGTIVLVEGYKGTNVVKEGASVAKGTLLISGVTTNADGSEYFSEASGKVFAQTENKFSCCTDLGAEKTVVVSDFQRYNFCFFNLIVPFGFYEEGELHQKTEIFMKGDTDVLPVGIIREDNITAENINLHLTDDEALLMNFNRCIKEKRENFDGVKFVKIDYIGKTEKEKANLEMKISCIEDIAERKFVVVEEN